MSWCIWSYLLIAETPFYHMVYLLDTSSQLSCLEALMFKVCEHLIVVHSFVKIEALHLLGIDGLGCWVGIKIPITSLVELFQLYLSGDLV
jgi:hypothetical protein